MKDKNVIQRPDRISTYFRMEWPVLLAVTISGIFYNIGLLAGPWFEGRLAQCLLDIFGGENDFFDMLRLAGAYVAVIAAVQIARYIKRFYVRRFGNHVNRNMKQVLYGNLVHHSKRKLESESIGSVMTKAISDVDACAEGMRKFTTEIFDTGVALAGYAVLLFTYDWKLALISLLFPPVSYFLAEKMKKIVQQSGAAAQESRGRLSAATLDRVSGASTYRVFGCEPQRDASYEEHLEDYEKAAVKANIWVAAMPPLYQIISMASVLFILYFGGRNVTGAGWSSWDIAAFTTFLSCFTKLAVKSAKAAKLFNAVQKAEVSWKRIKPLMKSVPEENPVKAAAQGRLEVQGLGMAYPGSSPVFSGLSFAAGPGQIVGVTGPVACGKTTLGRAFLCEYPYRGSIRFGKEELSSLSPERLWGTVGYLGHDPELLNDTVQDNILLGDNEDLRPLLKAVCLEGELAEMPDGIHTVVGSGGVRLSGGQQARLALARTLGHLRPLLILDDPFSALDPHTEKEVFENLRAMTKGSVVLLLSHRLGLFPQLDQIIWMENGKTRVGPHEELMDTCKPYADLYRLQKGGRALKQANKNGLLCVLGNVIRSHKLLTAGIFLAVAGAVAAALLPPLVLEKAVDLLTAGNPVPFALALSYFALTSLTSILDSSRESLMIVFGQKITHGLRGALCGKLSRLPADAFVKQEPGTVVSRFVNDVDTVEALFTSGIVSMFADGCKVASIFVVLFIKNPGLALVLLALLPLLFAFTRLSQKRMLAAQLANRAAVGKVTNHVPETIRCIRTIHALGKERYMRGVYDKHIQDSYEAVEKANFYDAVYSPVILIINALVVAVIMLLSATGVPQIQSFFGMSVGTAVAVIAYVGSVFAPLESIGMEIQTIQSAVAGVRRIDEFLGMEERWETEDSIEGGRLWDGTRPCVELQDVTFGYDKDTKVLQNLSLTVHEGEYATLTGRTGAGKSTVFKLLLGQYQPDAGHILVYGQEADRLPDHLKRKLFGYVEQSFRMVPGTVLDQITLFDDAVTREMAEQAAKTAGLHDTISALSCGYDTPCTASVFSQGQWQLLSISRAIAADPKILLLDEITANLDADTEQKVLLALQNASKNRTVISISHRLYQQMGGRQFAI